MSFQTFNFSLNGTVVDVKIEDTKVSFKYCGNDSEYTGDTQAAFAAELKKRGFKLVSVEQPGAYFAGRVEAPYVCPWHAQGGSATDDCCNERGSDYDPLGGCEISPEPPVLAVRVTKLQ